MHYIAAGARRQQQVQTTQYTTKQKQRKAKQRQSQQCMQCMIDKLHCSMRNCQWFWHACDPAWFLASCWTGLDCIYSFAQTMQRGDAKSGGSGTGTTSCLPACLPACGPAAAVPPGPGPPHALSPPDQAPQKHMTFQFPQTNAHDTVQCILLLFTPCYYYNIKTIS